MNCKYLRGLKSEPLWDSTTFQSGRVELSRTVLGKHKVAHISKWSHQGTEAGKAFQSQTLEWMSVRPMSLHFLWRQLSRMMSERFHDHPHHRQWTSLAGVSTSGSNQHLMARETPKLELRNNALQQFHLLHHGVGPRLPQSALPIQGFCIHRFNQLWVKNIHRNTYLY